MEPLYPSLIPIPIPPSLVSPSSPFLPFLLPLLHPPGSSLFLVHNFVCSKGAPDASLRCFPSFFLFYSSQLDTYFLLSPNWLGCLHSFSSWKHLENNTDLFEHNSFISIIPLFRRVNLRSFGFPSFVSLLPTALIFHKATAPNFLCRQADSHLRIKFSGNTARRPTLLKEKKASERNSWRTATLSPRLAFTTTARLKPGLFPTLRFVSQLGSVDIFFLHQTFFGGNTSYTLIQIAI